ncbi:hypothetical protein KUL25_10220 [Rhodobacteraceae bacterium N5(2021)]|uniref:Leucine-rich repeat domain-containing protein n=1 Tax=Gymnodinialimonas phycosphaerae TaxID=2841589 RepID=A0A975YHW4_9RHOB|nr:leucine-rich repeat domain-containing protein [Gymnodinialimonas phycosphaerae]MBY4893139.1 hypothetical protein [Gymnodinialimonas phycosphaerae]
MFRFAFPALTVLTLIACQPAAHDNTPYGQERVDECIATACATLNVDGLGLRDYGQVNALSHVTSLMVSYTDFDSLSDIADMAQLRELHLSNSQVTDLSGLAAFPNLALVHMQGVSAEALATARFPAGVRELALGGPGATDLSIVHRVPGLRRLHVDTFTTSVSLAALEGHGNLSTVHLGDIRGLDLSPLLALPALRAVSLEFEPGGPDPVQTSVIAQLRARGVTVSTEEVVVPVC